MSNPDTPADADQLRAEIEQTRADLGQTVQELAAKADVKARAKQAAGDAGNQVRQKLAGVKDQAAQAAGVVARRTSTARHQLADSDLPARLRQPLPLAVIGAAATAVIVAIVIAARSRR
ncbi:DUF3618 domain-containing protein [Actinoplanes sp. Pm04-4]|uniref:DUF3618 domain-containing protein n=1 Tax=Paractinoplanes pyxinae TaxID=2997416 RepID=A0ABT4AQM3_9ACTN|nr:DUF3618 domain-containing protein [Actinoplanes pyxinae]MCY1136541.1 DUF3618 domain-containing protein [Actinoplanes pyxinae]